MTRFSTATLTASAAPEFQEAAQPSVVPHLKNRGVFYINRAFLVRGAMPDLETSHARYILECVPDHRPVFSARHVELDPKSIVYLPYYGRIAETKGDMADNYGVLGRANVIMPGYTYECFTDPNLHYFGRNTNAGIPMIVRTVGRYGTNYFVSVRDTNYGGFDVQSTAEEIETMTAYKAALRAKYTKPERRPLPV